MAEPIDVIIVGNGLNSQGFVGANFATSGVCLNTYGFLFPCGDHWIDAEEAITTTWTAANTPGSTEVCAG